MKEDFAHSGPRSAWSYRATDRRVATMPRQARLADTELPASKRTATWDERALPDLRAGRPQHVLTVTSWRSAQFIAAAMWDATSTLPPAPAGSSFLKMSVCPGQTAGSTHRLRQAFP